MGTRYLCHDFRWKHLKYSEKYFNDPININNLIGKIFWQCEIESILLLAYYCLQCD